MSDKRHILHHWNTVHVLSHDLAGGHLALMEGLENVITGLSAWHSLTTEAVSHPGPLASASSYLLKIELKILGIF